MKPAVRATIALLSLCDAILIPAKAQQYMFSTYAGGAPLPTPLAAWDVSIATDYTGNAYFTSRHSVFKRDRSGAFTRIAGTSRPGYTGDGRPASEAQLYSSRGVAVDGAGNVFIADTVNHRIRKISSDGIIDTVAGNGELGYSGDGGPATSAKLSNPISLAVDRAGSLFIVDAEFPGFSDCGNRIRKVGPDGIIRTITGKGECSFFRPREVELAIDAQFTRPNRLAVDSDGNLFVTEPLLGVVRKISPEGILSTVAGSRRDGTSDFRTTCTAGAKGDGQPATAATLCLPYGVAMDSKGNLLIAEYGYRCCYDFDDPIIRNFVVRQVSPDGILSTVQGTATPGITVCDCDDVGSGFVAADDGNLFLSDSLLIRMVSPEGTVTTIADSAKCRIAVAGPATSVPLYGPTNVAIDGARNLYIGDYYSSRIRKVSPGGVISTVAGADTPGFSGDGGPARDAQLNGVAGMAVDSAGSLFLADSGNARVRKLSTDGTITTVAGGGDDARDGVQATSATLHPGRLAVDGAGNLFIADSANGRVRKLSPEGIMITVAGGGRWDRFIEVGPASDAFITLLALPWTRPETCSSRTLRTTASARFLQPGSSPQLAGNGRRGFSGDGGPATDAELTRPLDVAVDAAGNLLIIDDLRVRKISNHGIITTIAGNGGCCFSPDGGPADATALLATTIAGDGAGNIYLVDPINNAIRILRPGPMK